MTLYEIPFNWSICSITTAAGWLTVNAGRLVDGERLALDSGRFKAKSAPYSVVVGPKTKFRAESAPYIVASG